MFNRKVFQATVFGLFFSLTLPTQAATAIFNAICITRP